MRRLICAAAVSHRRSRSSSGRGLRQAGSVRSSTKTVTVSYFTFSAAPDHLNTLKTLISDLREETSEHQDQLPDRALFGLFHEAPDADRRRAGSGHVRARLRQLLRLRHTWVAAQSEQGRRRPIRRSIRPSTTRRRTRLLRSARRSTACRSPSRTCCSSTTRISSGPRASPSRPPSGRGRTRWRRPRS